jgi:hypothetical protein
MNSKCLYVGIFKSFSIFLLLSSLPLAASDAAERNAGELKATIPADEIVALQKVYRDWLLGSNDQAETPLSRQKRMKTIQRAQGTLVELAKFSFAETALVYDTRKAGADMNEVRFLVTRVLPDLSLAYSMPSSKDENPYFHDPKVLAKICSAFDRLYTRGFRQPMQMPWKPQQVIKSRMNEAIIVDFQLRISGYALATFLMKDELAAYGILQRSLATCEDIYSHDDKMGSLLANDLNSDSIRIAINFGLPWALAAGDAAGLDRLKRQLDTTFKLHADALDVIKPDGLGFHHSGPYLSGYATYAMSQGAQAAWLLKDSPWRLDRDTIANLHLGLITMRTVSQKYEIPKGLAGRLGERMPIINAVLGYACLADIEASKDPTLLKVLARLADPAFMKEYGFGIFEGFRNEVPAGPGAVHAFERILTAARNVGAEASPPGNWAFNYGPLAVHRRDEWMLCIKGCSSYLWAFERSVTDARGDARQQNLYGIHDSAFNIEIFNNSSNSLSSGGGFEANGWDWCKIPGSTTRFISPKKLQELDIYGKALNRPYANSPFAGGLSVHGQQGLFAMAYNEVTMDQDIESEQKSKIKKSAVLQAEKSAFFFDDKIVVLTSGVRNGDGVHTVGTTLFQAGLKTPETKTCENGIECSALHDPKLLDSASAATLVDPFGNGYYIPTGKNLWVSRTMQQSISSTGAPSNGLYAAAWIDHGKLPDNNSCEYVILVNTSADSLASFAKTASNQYQVLQKDSAAHVVKQIPLKLTGFAVFDPSKPLSGGLLKSVDRPLLVMADESKNDEISLSVCDPDHHWIPGVDFQANDKDLRTKNALRSTSKPIEIKFVIAGKWRLAPGVSDVTLSPSGNDTTTLTVKAVAAAQREFKLLRQ